MITEKHKNIWEQKALNLEPELIRCLKSPVYHGEVIPSKQAFFKYEFVRETKIDASCKFNFENREELFFDFGEHIVGDFQFDVELIGENVGGPLRLKIIFGEIPAELVEDIEPYSGTLSRAWFQDEIVTLEYLPQTVKFSRQFAFQYVKIALEAKSFDYEIAIKNPICNCTTSASPDFDNYVLQNLPNDLRKIDEVSLRTLRNTMQSTFIDGPKRDKRLWLGDFPLLAKTNYLTFDNTDLVKRCFYLFASQLKSDGKMPACIYTNPQIYPGEEYIVDFAVMFGSYLLEYGEATYDWDLVKELWPVAFLQAQIIMDKIDDSRLFRSTDDWWVFIDWNPQLQKDASINAVIIYSLKQLSMIAERYNYEDEKKILDQTVAKMEKAVLDKFYDSENEIFVSGNKKQVSWASQVWMILAEVVDSNTARKILLNMLEREDSIRSVTPFVYHYTLETLFSHRLNFQAMQIIKDYWGGMIKEGGTTFWEVYKNDDYKFSPYENYLLNSYCHSWSCTPAYFFRKYKVK
ncbi:MAG: hypothetical protein JSW63_03920 [Ignavibacterium sp.]|nr:MAG: hypothetical protein JSW63_03920 [Ignavibacterium sp.]